MPFENLFAICGVTKHLVSVPYLQKLLILHIILYYNAHSITQIAALGGNILMIGFMGFILGCRYQYLYDYSGVDSVVVLANPFLSGLIAALTSLFINRYFENKWSLFVAINGALTGMVSFAIGGQKR